MASRGSTRKDVIKSQSTEELPDDNSHERSEAECNHDQLIITERLSLISASVSYHSEFLRGLTAMQFTVTNDDNSGEKEVTWVRKSSAVQKAAENEACDVKINEKGSSENILSSQAGIHVSCPGSSLGSDCGVGPESPETDGRTTHRSPTVVEFSKDDQYYAAINTTKRPPKPFSVQYSFQYNMNTLIFHAAGESSIAVNLNERVLSAVPDNFNALWNNVRLMVDCDHYVHERAEEILRRLEELVFEGGKQMLTAKAEIAAMNSALQVSADSLVRSIQLFEEVLSELGSSDPNRLSGPIPENLIAFWKCCLVENYGNLTNANRNILAKYGFTHGKVLARIEGLVQAVDCSEYIEGKLKAQTWVDLANTFEHYKQNYPKERFVRDIYDGVSLADCFGKAREYDPGNPRILMRSGRELRQRARTEGEMETAIGYFEMALTGENIDSIRDILHHHTGLAYRSLWTHTERPTFDHTLDNCYRFRSNDYLRCLVIKPPDGLFDFDLIPPPYKQAPKSARQKIINPIARDPENEYMLKAREHFEEANHFYYEQDLSNPLYLLEIARIHSSARDVEKARQCLQEAEKQRDSDAVDEDFIGSSLYENLGLLEETELPSKGFGEPEVEEVKRLYRESIRFSAISKTKPIVAYYYLLRILYKQLEGGGADRDSADLDRMILQDEYFLLYMAIQDTNDGQDIVKYVASNDFRIALIWRLIDNFYQRNQPNDAAAVLSYLTILAMGRRKLTTKVKGINLTSLEKQRIIIESAERVAIQRVEQPRFLPGVYRQLYELRCSSSAETNWADSSSDSEPLSELEKRKLNIVMRILRPRLEPAYVRRHERC